jgi:RNA polymerase sigma factor (sigma-70 family)
MSKIDVIDNYIELYDLYKKMLTPTQRKIFELYYFDDLSLNEIAKDLNISKPAVHDSIKTSQKLLDDYENKIGFNLFRKKNS